jgi:hypothetical protein
MYLSDAQPPLLSNDKEGLTMVTPMVGQSIDEAAAAHFMLDSHHLAMLDRFVARARRHAMHSGREFTGVMVAIDPTQPVSVFAADMEPLVLGIEACVARETAMPTHALAQAS